jgi:hypothetical protein
MVARDRLAAFALGAVPAPAHRAARRVRLRARAFVVRACACACVRACVRVRACVSWLRPRVCAALAVGPAPLALPPHHPRRTGVPPARPGTLAYARCDYVSGHRLHHSAECRTHTRTRRHRDAPGSLRYAARPQLRGTLVRATLVGALMCVVCLFVDWSGCCAVGTGTGCGGSMQTRLAMARGGSTRTGCRTSSAPSSRAAPYRLPRLYCVANASHESARCTVCAGFPKSVAPAVPGGSPAVPGGRPVVARPSLVVARW